MLKKKSQGLSLNYIIIAAIGLIVLVIIIFIFKGGSTTFVKSTTCPARDGTCLAEGSTGCPDGKPVKIYTSDCPDMKLEDGKYVKKDPEKKPGQCCVSLTK